MSTQEQNNFFRTVQELTNVGIEQYEGASKGTGTISADKLISNRAPVNQRGNY